MGDTTRIGRWGGWGAPDWNSPTGQTGSFIQAPADIQMNSTFYSAAFYMSEDTARNCSERSPILATDSDSLTSTNQCWGVLVMKGHVCEGWCDGTSWRTADDSCVWLTGRWAC